MRFGGAHDTRLGLSHLSARPVTGLQATTRPGEGIHVVGDFLHSGS
jgi:hypothetical protein